MTRSACLGSLTSAFRGVAPDFFRRDAGWFDPALTLERGAGLSRCQTEPSQGNAGYLVEDWDNAAAKRWR
ncbi:conserved hypothetical protein [Mesorhizobium delmotii]|uniref:Uncharacterized protein n=1 Tax=Mesorhizobium delmotii TaxID=1631247 RepID=A0A2P9AL75_9HYPH|nr:conserved hypothetical protein [Mesorhizobium delmotii]